MHYVVASVTAYENYQTKQITVRGLLGVAPNDYTVIEYPGVGLHLLSPTRRQTKMYQCVKCEWVNRSSERCENCDSTREMRHVEFNPWVGEWVECNPTRPPPHAEINANHLRIGCGE